VFDEFEGEGVENHCRGRGIRVLVVSAVPSEVIDVQHRGQFFRSGPVVTY
jgi:hypothetical protein